MRSFIKWLRPSFEGDDQKASFRRLSAFILLGLMIYVGAIGAVTSMIQLYALSIYTMAFLLLVGIVTVDNLMTFASKCKLKE